MYRLYKHMFLSSKLKEHHAGISSRYQRQDRNMQSVELKTSAAFTWS
jgi:hypothetical protein